MDELPATSAPQYPAGSGVGVSVLLRQPGGFEGLFPGGVFAHLDEAARPDRVDGEKGQRSLDSCVLGAATQALFDHHARIIDLGDLLGSQDQVVEETAPVLEVSPDRIAPSHPADVIDSALDCSPLDVWVE